MISRLFARVGKSHICKKMVDKGYTVLFVCHTIGLFDKFEGDVITISRFFGRSFGDA